MRSWSSNGWSFTIVKAIGDGTAARTAPPPTLLCLKHFPATAQLLSLIELATKNLSLPRTRSLIHPVAVCSTIAIVCLVTVVIVAITVRAYRRCYHCQDRESLLPPSNFAAVHGSGIHPVVAALALLHQLLHLLLLVVQPATMLEERRRLLFAIYQQLCLPR